MLSRIIIIFGVFCAVASDLEYIGQSAENTNSSESSEQNITNTDKKSGAGKTYFIQLRKNKNSEEKTYEFVNHYNTPLNNSDTLTLVKGKIIGQDNEDILIGLINKSANKETINSKSDIINNIDEDPSEYFLDEEWSFQKNTNFEFPNISQEIYEAMLENNKHNTMKNASTVRCLFEIPNAENEDDILMFDTSHLRTRNKEVLVEAELYVYTRKNETNFFDKAKQGNEHILRLYQILDINHTDTNNRSYTPDLHKLINVVYIPAGYAGWQVFKVRGVIENWLQGADNLGLLLAARDGSDNTLDLNIVHRDNNGGIYQPTLILYYEKKNKPCEIEEVIHRKERVSSSPQQQRRTVNQRHMRLLQKGVTPCGRHIWYVSFHQLGWNNFILSPHGFMAYRCRGQCIPVPFSAPYTNHAKLESNFGEDKQMKHRPQPCCVPQRYKPLVLMFHDRYQNVIIKRYEEMIVDECGCR